MEVKLIYNFEIIKEFAKRQEEYNKKYGHLDKQFIWELEDEIKNIFKLNMNSIVYKKDIVKLVDLYSKENNLNITIEEIDYVFDDLVKHGYLQEKELFENSYIHEIKLDENDKFYSIGNEYKIYLEKQKEEKRLKLLKKIGNAVSQYTVDFHVTLDKALEDIKNFMMSNDK